MKLYTSMGPNPAVVAMFLAEKGAQVPTEKVDLSATQPEKLAEIRALLAAKDAEMVAPAWPSLIEGPIPIDHPLGVPDSDDDEYVYWPN